MLLQQRARDSAGKLSLDDLLIKPVQRIPRYVLFVKDLLKHTNHTHPDHTLLQQALGELTMLAESVNESERERERLDQHKELLSAVDGLSQVSVDYTRRDSQGCCPCVDSSLGVQFQLKIESFALSDHSSRLCYAVYCPPT